MSIRQLTLGEFKSQCEAQIEQVRRGGLVIQLINDGQIVALVQAPAETAPPQEQQTDTEKAPKFWDEDTMALLKRTSHFRIGPKPTREEMNERR